VLGAIVLENYEREHAFGAAAVRLLTTVAASMGVALENARLFDETQRLLKETEQRAAELAIVNTVQQSLASKLDIQGVYDAVGDKLREVFPESFVGIRIYDRTTGVVRYPYTHYDGQRRSLADEPLGDRGFGPHVLRTGKTLVINERMDEAIRAYDSHLLAQDVSEPKSQLMVPLMVGTEARGLIQLSDVRREKKEAKKQLDKAQR
jgi:GAF domain-containing protein